MIDDLDKFMSISKELIKKESQSGISKSISPESVLKSLDISLSNEALDDASLFNTLKEIIDYYPDRQIFSGKVKNVGKVRADFVRVAGKLFDQTTANVGLDSIFIKGSRITYNSNVVADTALEPGQTAPYSLTVPIFKGKKAQYHTMDIRWNSTE